MTQTRFDVLTIGNAIVDIIAPVEPGFIEREGMKEGIMHLIDTDRAEDLYAKMPLGREQISGGSAANTAAGVASLGGRAAFVGKAGPRRRPTHGALDDPDHAGWRADHEHLSGRLPRTDRARYPSR